MIFGTGIDIVEVERIAKAIERWGEGFLEHVFTREEIKYSQKHRYPNEHFAARFAAKEAVLKAIGDNADIEWKDIEIHNDKHGRPLCIFHRKKFKHAILISISHTKNYAVASAVITSEKLSKKK